MVGLPDGKVFWRCRQNTDVWRTDGRTDKQTDRQTFCNSIVRAMHTRRAVISTAKFVAG